MAKQKTTTSAEPSTSLRVGDSVAFDLGGRTFSGVVSDAPVEICGVWYVYVVVLDNLKMMTRAERCKKISE